MKLAIEENIYFSQFVQKLDKFNYKCYENELGMRIRQYRPEIENYSFHDAREHVLSCLAETKNYKTMALIWAMKSRIKTCIYDRCNLNEFGTTFECPNTFLDTNNRLTTLFSNSLTEEIPKILLIATNDISSGKYISRTIVNLSKEFITVAISETIHQIVRCLRDAKIQISFTLSLSETDVINITLTESTSGFASKFLTSMNAWIVTHKIDLQYGMLDLRPLNHRVIKSIFQEVVEESVDYTKDFLNDINMEVGSILTRIKDLVSQFDGGDITSTILKWQEAKALIRKAKMCSKVRISDNLRRGIFKICPLLIKEQLSFFFTSKEKDLERKISGLLQTLMEKLLTTQNMFLTLPECSNYEQTRDCIIELNKMQENLPDITNQIENIKKIEEFMGSISMNLTDPQFQTYCECLKSHGKITVFLKDRFHHVSEQMIKLRVTIGREITAFLNLWSTVHKVLEKIFPSKQNEIPSKPSTASSKPGSRKNRLFTAAAENHLQILLKNLKNALQVAYVIQKKVDCISQFTDVPKSAELKKVCDYANTCQAIISSVINIQANIRLWRNSAIFKLNHELIKKTANEFLGLVDISDPELAFSKVVQFAYSETKNYLAIEYSVTKILLYPHFKSLVRLLNSQLALGKNKEHTRFQF